MYDFGSIARGQGGMQQTRQLPGPQLPGPQSQMIPQEPIRRPYTGLPGPQMPRTMSGPNPMGGNPQGGGGFSPSNLGGQPQGVPENLTANGGSFANNPNTSFGMGMAGSRPVVHALGRMKGVGGTGTGVNAGQAQQLQAAPPPPQWDPNDPNNAALAGYMSR